MNFLSLRSDLTRSVLCGLTRTIISGTGSSGVARPAILERHSASCLSCQAASVRQHRMLRDLAALRNELQNAPYDMSAALSRPMPVERNSRVLRPRPGMKTVAAGASMAVVGAVILTRRMLRSDQRDHSWL